MDIKSNSSPIGNISGELKDRGRDLVETALADAMQLQANHCLYSRRQTKKTNVMQNTNKERT